MATNREFFRLLAVGMGLPAVLVASDELLLAFAKDDGGWWPRFFVWLVVQTGLMSLAAGKWLEGWRWRAIVLSWTLLLLNIVLFHAAALAAPEMLAVAFVSAQLSLLAAWLVLGAAAWQWRLPAAAIALLPAGLVISELDRRRLEVGDVWKEIAVLQLAATLVFAVLLRWRGYRVERMHETSCFDESSADKSASQFSLRHLLAWTAALAPLLLLLQALDYAFMQRLHWRQWSVLLADSVLLAPVALVSFWAALGKGRAWSKVIWLALIAAAMGFALYFIEARFGTVPGWLAGNVSGFYIWAPSGKSYVIKITNAGSAWLAWTELSAFLLAGMLLVFRVDGYRLVRSKPCA
ncbi:MAG TPA: hypothetical protein VHB99_02900 [Pirellulales bacterium]|nr:hypothetical protein [Pirellulales bacterium]